MPSEVNFAINILTVIALVLPALIILSDSIGSDRTYEIRLNAGALLSFVLLSVVALSISILILVKGFDNPPGWITISVIFFIIGYSPVILGGVIYFFGRLNRMAD
jgi:hypothetical protein